MHKPFYASGFLYHSSSGQILLQQLRSDTNANLVLFGGKSRNGSNPQTVFRRYVEKALGIAIPATSIHPIYDYIEDNLGEQFIFYAEVSDVAVGAHSPKNKSDWFSLSKLSKHAMSEQTRHDVIVGERVIRATITPQT